MEFEFQNVEIKNEEEFEIVDIKIEDEEEDNKYFFGFDESEAEVKLPVFYKDVLSDPVITKLVPSRSELVNDYLIDVHQTVDILTELKEEIKSSGEENFDISILNNSTTDSEVPVIHKESVGCEETAVLELVQKIESVNDNPSPVKLSNTTPTARSLVTKNKRKQKLVCSKRRASYKYCKKRQRSKPKKRSNCSLYPLSAIQNFEIDGCKSTDHRSRILKNYRNNIVEPISKAVKPIKSIKMVRKRQYFARKSLPASDTDKASLKTQIDNGEHLLTPSLHCIVLSKQENFNKGAFNEQSSTEKTDNTALPNDTSLSEGEYEDIQQNILQEKNKIETPEKSNLYSHDSTNVCACDLCKRKKKLTFHKKRHTDEVPYKCHYCDFQCTSLSILSKHKIKHEDIKRFSCKFCSSKTSTKRSLDRHVATLHEKPSVVTCSLCEYRCSTRKKLYNHMIVHTGKSYYECSSCNYKHFKQAVMKKHMIAHEENSKLKCQYCTFKAVKLEYIQRHMRKSHKDMQENPEDNYVKNEIIKDDDSYNDSGNEMDIEVVNEVSCTSTDQFKHPIILLPRCDDVDLFSTKILKNQSSENVKQCTNAFQTNTPSDFNTLLGISNPGQNCPSDYEDTFTTKHDNDISLEIVKDELIYLTQHEKKVKTVAGTVILKEIVYKKSEETNKIHKCSSCRFSCTSMRELERHLKTHTNKIVFPCEHCDFTSISRRYLLTHKKTKHSNNVQHKCNLCNFKCVFYEKLKQHKKTHKNKPFKCTRCDYRCKTITDLKVHNDKHDGIKPYSCDYCDFCCTTKGTLKAHTFVHTGETKHVCEICNYKSANSTCLKKHMKIHEVNTKSKKL